MSLSSLGFLISEGFRNIRRNGLMSVAALSTVAVALTILGASLWFAFRLQEIASRQPQKLNEVAVFLNVETERDKAEEVQTRIEKLQNVKSVTIVPKEKAWQELQAGQPSLTEVALDNPLPDAFKIEVTDVSKMDSVINQLKDSSLFPEINWINSSNREVKTMLAIASLVKILGGAASVGMTIATLFIINNTIRLTVFARRKEIRIMQMVGATPRFIRFPLMLEGLFHGITGGIIASILLLVCGSQVTRMMLQVRSPLLGEIPTRLTPLIMVASLVSLGAILSYIGRRLAVRRFLKQI